MSPVGIRTLDPKFLYLIGYNYAGINDEHAGDDWWVMIITDKVIEEDNRNNL